MIVGKTNLIRIEFLEDCIFVRSKEDLVFVNSNYLENFIMKTQEESNVLKGKKESKKAYYLRNAVLLFLLLLFTVISMFSNNILYKVLASLSFVAAGIMNYFCEPRQRKTFSCLLIWGLIFGLFGDVGILIDFRIGALLFAIGHVLYYLSFCKINPPSAKDILPIVICILCSTAAVCFVLPPETSAFMRCICLLYACIISLMTGKSVSMYFSLKNSLSLLLVIGSIIFFLSDLMILLFKFSNENKILFRNICRCLYFPAQFILAQAPSVRSAHYEEK